MQINEKHHSNVKLTNYMQDNYMQINEKKTSNVTLIYLTNYMQNNEKAQ